MGRDHVIRGSRITNGILKKEIDQDSQRCHTGYRPVLLHETCLCDIHTHTCTTAHGRRGGSQVKGWAKVGKLWCRTPGGVVCIQRLGEEKEATGSAFHWLCDLR